MCNCANITVLEGKEAIELSNNIEMIGADGMTWETLYRCIECRTYWLETHPMSGLQGGGPIVLTKVEDMSVVEHFPKFTPEQRAKYQR